jgi:hypothetical protein
MGATRAKGVDMGGASDDETVLEERREGKGSHSLSQDIWASHDDTVIVSYWRHMTTQSFLPRRL